MPNHRGAVHISLSVMLEETTCVRALTRFSRPRENAARGEWNVRVCRRNGDRDGGNRSFSRNELERNTGLYGSVVNPLFYGFFESYAPRCPEYQPPLEETNRKTCTRGSAIHGNIYDLVIRQRRESRDSLIFARFLDRQIYRVSFSILFLFFYFIFPLSHG